jgi:hypothetical protein
MLSANKTIAGLLLLCSLNTMAATFPLNYNLAHGLYSVKLYVGNQKKPIDTMVDTGSANLNFITNKTKCKNCVHFNGASLLNIKDSGAKKIYKDTFYVIHYGSAGGYLLPYTGKVGFSKSTQIPTIFSGYAQGTHISNILGLAYKNIASPAMYPLKPYFNTVMQHYRVHGFALALCGQLGHSHITIGLKKLYSRINPRNIQFAPISVNKYYITMLNSISGVLKNGKQKTLISYHSPYTKTTIIDSGTGGFIVLPTNDHNKIIKFIYSHTPKSAHAVLGKGFWNSNTCVNKSLINYKQFPNLIFTLEKAGAPKKSIDIKLRPQEYITASGCSASTVQLSFLTMNRDMKRELPRRYMNHIPSLKVLGTPFFEHRLVIFDRGPYKGNKFGRIGFVNLNNQCKPQTY